MSDEVTIKDHLKATLSHLSVRRAKLIVELNSVELVIEGIRRELQSFENRLEHLPFPDNSSTGTPLLYSGMSVRWAILMFLAEGSDALPTVGQIADALKAGGMTSKGMSFNSNVSAVLSQMTLRGEVEKMVDRFALTVQGRQSWGSIKESDKFKTRLTLIEAHED